MTTTNPVTKVGEQVAERPTETVTGLALAGLIYGFLTQAGLENAVAAVIAIVVAFLPTAVSNIVDRVRGNREP